MNLKILSVAAVSLALMSGAALSEPVDAGGYEPAASTAVIGSSVDTMRTSGVRSSAQLVTAPSINDRAQTSREGGGEPSSVDALSPSIVSN